MSKLIFVFLLSCFTTYIESIPWSIDSRLQTELIQVVFRHGQRTTYPYETYPGNQHQVSSILKGKLTSAGEHRLQKLGRALAKEYRELLDQEVQVRSLDREACQDSARYLYKELKNDNVAVHTLPEDSDALLNLRACPAFRNELHRVRRLPHFLEAQNRFEGLFRYLHRKVGQSFDDLTDHEQHVYQLYSVLELQRGLNLSLPDWYTDELYELMGKVAELHHDIESGSKLLRRLNGGPLLKSFIEMLNRQDARGVRLAAVEDRQLAGLVRALGSPYPRLPDFGNAVILEKRRDRYNGQLFVRLMVWTWRARNIFPVRIIGCSTDCPLKRFIELVVEALPSDQELKCLNG